MLRGYSIFKRIIAIDASHITIRQKDLLVTIVLLFFCLQVTWLQHNTDFFRLLTVGRTPYSNDQRISLNFR